MSGQTPCQYVEATSLAALLLQVELGNFTPSRDSKGSLKEKMKQLVAPQHIKQVCVFLVDIVTMCLHLLCILLFL